MNKDKQQTAVDWYAEEHLKLLIQLENKELSLGAYVVKHSDILKQAKQMEKSQTEETCISVIERIIDKSEKGEEVKSEKIFEKYYRETYGED